MLESPPRQGGIAQVTDAVRISLCPRWDPDRRQLRLGERLIKHFRTPAPNQVLILSAFQELGWPRRIDDPLPPHNGQDPKQRLHNAINCLNRSHQTPHLLRFHGDGTGSGILWDLILV